MHPLDRQHGLQQFEQRFTSMHLQEYNLKQRQQEHGGHESRGNLQHFGWHRHVFFKQLQPGHLEQAQLSGISR